MKKTKKRALYILAALLGALFVLSCLVGFAACGGGSTEDNATVSTVSVTADKSSIAVGETATLTASVTMSDGGAYDGSYTWSSNATSVASVESSGATATVTAKAEGEATITVAVADSKSASCKVTVTGGSDQGGPTGAYDNTLTIEAEDAALFNSMSSSASSTTLIGTEQTTLSDDTVITNVKNFNTAGDKIVFQVLASAAIENVAISITAGNGALMGGTFSDNDKILTVNGGDPIALTGTLTNTAFNWSTYGTLTGTISLQKGINYIEITAASTIASGYLNVDRIDLSWDGTATIEEVNDYTGEVFDVDATGVATMEAEDASLMNGVSSTTGTTASLMKTEISTEASGNTCVSNFDTTGDKIVFQVNAAAAVTVQIDLVASTTYFLGTTLDVSTTPNLLSVNGTAVTLTGTLTNGAFSFYDFGTVTATGVSLSKGINYIVLDYQDNNMNVDRIDLNGGTGAEAEPEPEATQVSTADALVAALAEGGEIELTADIAASSTLTVSADTTIDLAGNTLSSGTYDENTQTTSGWTPVAAASNGVVSDVMISVGNGVNLTIEDSSADGTGTIAYTYVGPTVNNVFGSTTYSWNAAGNHGAAIMVDGNENTSVTIESGTISSSSVGIRAKNGSVEINGGVIYSSGYYVIWEDTGKTYVTINDGLIYGDWGGILVDGDSRFKGSYSEGAVTTLTVNGGVVYSGDAANSAIRTENQGSIDSAIINVYGGYVICADNPQSDTNYEAGIFVGNGTLTVADGTDENNDVTSSPVIVGPTAIEVQGGTTTISGGTIISNATGDQSIQSVTSSDPFTYGYALAINPRANISSQITGYTAKTDVEISGGTFVGDIYAIATANGTTESTWNVSFTKDATEQTTQNYVVTMTAITLNPYDSNGDPITDQSTETTAYYLWKYEDLTSNFVTGAYNQSGSIPEEAYKVGGVAFTDSEVTSVDRVGTTYIVTGTAAKMSDDQIKAFWGETEAENHTDAQYIMILITADTSDSFTIVTEKNPEGYEMGGASGNDGFSMCFAVSDADTAEGAYLFTIVVDGVSFDVVLGTITLAATT